jgi:hypothetical protein
MLLSGRTVMERTLHLREIKRNATKQTYEEFQKDAAEELTVDEVYD